MKKKTHVKLEPTTFKLVLQCTIVLSILPIGKYIIEMICKEENDRSRTRTHELQISTQVHYSTSPWGFQETRATSPIQISLVTYRQLRQTHLGSLKTVRDLPKVDNITNIILAIPYSSTLLVQNLFTLQFIIFLFICLICAERRRLFD